MHEGCAGHFNGGEQIVDKLRQMGFGQMALPVPVEIDCEGCGETFPMTTLEASCPQCGMVYGVTPCHAHDRASIQAAGINY